MAPHNSVFMPCILGSALCTAPMGYRDTQKDDSPAHAASTRRGWQH